MLSTFYFFAIQFTLILSLPSPYLQPRADSSVDALSQYFPGFKTTLEPFKIEINKYGWPPLLKTQTPAARKRSAPGRGPHSLEALFSAGRSACWFNLMSCLAEGVEEETVISCHANWACVITPTQDSAACEARCGRLGLLPPTHMHWRFPNKRSSWSVFRENAKRLSGL